jgi:hypothetical protein
MSAPETYVKNHDRALLSYAAPGTGRDNEFLVLLGPRLKLRIKKTLYRFDVESLFSS